jgi:nucleoside-diphosphate-sugar epimerase
MTHQQAFTFVAGVLGKPAPKVKSPVVITKAIARIFDLVGAVTHKQPWITSELISGLGMYNWYSIDKAVRQLGYSPSSLEDAVTESYRWYIKNGMLK